MASFTALSHSINSRGELGAFVNPETCACQTCSALVGDPTPSEPRPSAPISEPASGAFTGGWAWTGSGTGAGASLFAETPSRQPTVSLPPPPPLRRTPSLVPQTPLSLEEQEAAILRQLVSFQASLQLRQDAVYEEPSGSHSDLAMADMEWSDLDEKIAAIESLLSKFRAQ
jgi:hypothetical protein